MKYLHAMIRVHDLDATSRFFTEGLGLTQTRRMDNEAGASPWSISARRPIRKPRSS